jgi:nicotinamidase-related amidase
MLTSRREFALAGLLAPALFAGRGLAATATPPKTLLDLANQPLKPSSLSHSVLIVIDAQNEYRHGPLALDGIETAIKRLAALLQRARAAGTPIIHIAQTGDPGDMFDRKGERGQFMTKVAPHDGETVIEKPLPNSFARTPLQDRLVAIGRKDIIVAGFMTHMCVSCTVRAGFDLDYHLTVAADATATRALPAAPGTKTLPAADIQAAALAELGDYFAAITPSDAIPA